MNLQPTLLFLCSLLLWRTGAAQNVGHRASLSKLVGQTPETIEEGGRSGGSYDQARFDSPGLGGGVTVPPYDRYGWTAVTSVGGVFLRAIAEQAGGGDDPVLQDQRRIVGLTGATEDLVQVQAGGALQGAEGFATIPLQIRFRAVRPDPALGSFGVFWTFAVNYVAVAGDPETGTPSWEQRGDYSEQSLIIGEEIVIPGGDDFNTLGPVMLRVPVVFGTRQLLAITGGVSLVAPLSQPRAAGDEGSLARLSLEARFLPGEVVKVETGDGTALPPGSWEVEYASGHNYAALPWMPAPEIGLPRTAPPTEPGLLSFVAAPGLTYTAESREWGGDWIPLGAPVAGDGTLVRIPWAPTPASARWFRLGYALTP